MTEPPMTGPPMTEPPMTGPPMTGPSPRAPELGAAAMEPLVRDCRVIICAGPGGVGKTTVAAAIALHAARRGKRACVVTIDPAKRLADALGLQQLTNEARSVEGAVPKGSPAVQGGLWALMLDTKSTFDEVVVRNAASEEQAQVIMGNKLYRNVSGALGGTQEYMAMEKLYALNSSDEFDLVVVDTPPTRHALDFLDAPNRLLRFLNNRVFRLLMTPTRASLRAVSVASQVVLKSVSKVVGGAIVADAIAFFTAFEGMEQGFRDRAERVGSLLADEATTFVVVSAPRRDAITEAAYFADRLRHSSGSVGALVLNRMFPSFGPVPEGLTGDHALNLGQLDRVASSEERFVEELSAGLPGAPVVRIPFLADDVHDLPGLAEVGRWMFEEPDPG